MSDATDLGKWLRDTGDVTGLDLYREHRGQPYEDDTVLPVTLLLDAGERERLLRMVGTAVAASRVFNLRDQDEIELLATFIGLEIAKAERRAGQHDAH